VTNLFFHGGAVSMDHDSPMGSLMYDLMGEHRAALVGMAVVLLAALVVFRFGSGPVASAFRTLTFRGQAVGLLLLVDAGAHAGLVVTASGGWRMVFLGSALATGAVVWRLLHARTWRLWGVVLLGGALIGYWVELLRGHPTDQIGLTVKLIELIALALILEPSKAKWRPMRRMVATATVGIAVLFNTAFAWAGAFGGNRSDAAAPLDHHIAEGHRAPRSQTGGTVTPGMVMLPHNAAQVSAVDRRQADALWEATAAAIATFANPQVAAAAGYGVEGLSGDDFHAPNPGYQHDGRILDPTRPENLVYAMGPEGPVVMGVMFETQGLRDAPPANGGPFLKWHKHEQVCFSLLPPGLAGLVDPQGMCPVGSIAITTTNSMMHVWTVPGPPQRFGDLDQVWKNNYLDSLSG